ncbi:MAG TPA: type II toxin-antitoxin system HicB family antitoxin [Candidatus Kapabacteria bacterium]|jgi:predicted RNase H-like HicB family nuclease
MKYLIITEPTETGFSAYSPDVPGCIATGATEDEVKKNMLEALEFHFEGMQEDGLEIPEPHTHAHYLEPVF